MSAEDLLVNAQDAVGAGQLIPGSIGVVPDHSLHFSHVSQVGHPYDISAIQPDLSYGAFPMHQEGQLAPHSYPLPDPAILSQQRKTERRRPPGKKNTDAPHVPRPRNAFILFRSAFIEQKNGKELASKQQNVSRIAALVWKSMNSAEQDPWYKLAAEEKQAHYAANPGYTFQPSGRGDLKKKTRKPTTEPAIEEGSCKRIAELIINGVHGDDLVTAAKNEGVAPYQKQEGDRRRRRRDPAVPDPLDSDINRGTATQRAEEDSSGSEAQHFPSASPNQFQYGSHGAPFEY
ncbi:hypothetical protein FRB91_011992 [Serendipita sp. 411]|nr:hypothetical protein FRC19_005559 [Serendipita sp. 401]KAG8822346.1 hypothetical protein FRC18_011037 [Serendipita sp. 400]KAG8847216.1 hypothetical protein FRB91_011992 [Serendipita sp. 411]KAG8855782.1 hypothetical protein FRC20_000707 [Serendipita sp. 405]KAG9027560.1 hypothetical protein FS842_004908 [Serendipita sp. 407]